MGCLVKVDIVVSVRVAVRHPGMIFVQGQVQSFISRRLEHAAVKVKSGHHRPWGHYAGGFAYAQKQACHVIEFQFHRQTIPQVAGLVTQEHYILKAGAVTFTSKLKHYDRRVRNTSVVGFQMDVAGEHINNCVIFGYCCKDIDFIDGFL